MVQEKQSDTPESEGALRSTDWLGLPPPTILTGHRCAEVEFARSWGRSQCR